MMSVDSRFINRFMSASKKRQTVYTMVIFGLLLIFIAEYELYNHQDRIIVNYDEPSRSGYYEIIVGLPDWVYPMVFTGLTLCIIGTIWGCRVYLRALSLRSSCTASGGGL